MGAQELALSLFLVGLPALIFVGVIFGSRLPPQTKRRLETWFLLPLFVVLTAIGVGVAAVQHWWVQLAVVVVLFGLATERLISRLRHHRDGPQAS